MRKINFFTSAFFFSLFVSRTFATTWTWTGGAGSPNFFWNSPANWSADSGQPATGDSVIFTASGAQQTTNSNNIPGLTSLVNFAAQGGAYTWSGDACELFNVNVTGGSHTLNFNLPLTVTNIDITISSGLSLIINGAITDVNGLQVTGGGTVALRGSNSYSGGTTVGTGTVLEGYPASVIGNISNFGTVAFDTNSPGTSSASIIGTGGVLVTTSGTPGTVTVTTGPTDYFGTTIINAPAANTLSAGSASVFSAASNFVVNGTLALNTFNQTIASLSGSGTVNLGSATLTISNSAPTNFSGSITGTGSLTYSGISTLNLSGNNNYSGATLISFGVFQAGAAFTFAPLSSYTVNATMDLNGNPQTIFNLFGSGAISLSAPLTINGGATGSFSGQISGTGSLSIQGGSVLELQGTNNTYSGITDISVGTIEALVANTLSKNSAHIVDATLNLNNFSQTIGSLSGGGTVSLGSATLTMGFDNTSTVFFGSIGGSGSVTKIGSGISTLAGTSTYSGTTTVSAGTLTVNGTIADGTTLVVASGATLKGTGTVSGVGSISGTVQPGNSIGTLTLAGNQTFLPGSTYSTEVSPVVSSLLIINPGNLTIDPGSTLQVTVDPGSYTIGGVYPIIEIPAGTITAGDTFSTVNFSSGLVMFETQYLSNQLNLVVTKFIPFIDIVTTGHAGQVAKCLDSATGHSTGDLAAIIVLLQFSSPSTIQAALNNIAAPVYTNLALAQQNNTFRVRESISSHLEQLYQRSCTLLTEGEVSSNLWTDVYGDWVSERGNSNKPGFGATTGGALIGYDYSFWKEFFLGASAAYTYTDFNWKQHRGDGNIQSYYGTFYLGYHKSYFYTNAMLTGAYNNYAAHRKIQFPSINRVAKSTPQGHEVAASGEMGLLFEVGKNYDVGVFLILDYVYLHQKAFREHGAQGLNFTFREKNANILRTEAGFQASYCYEQENYVIKPWVKVSYVRESRFEGAHEDSSFIGQSCNMHFTGLYPNRNIIAPAASMTIYFSGDTMSLGLWYEGEFGDSYTDNKGHLQFGYSF